MKKIFSNIYVRYGLLVLAGLFLGWLLFHSNNKTTNEQKSTVESKKQIWTCSMHPQIHLDHPGKCPICGMELILLQNAGAKVDSNAVVFSKEAMELANVSTSVVSRQKPVKEVRLYGKVQADERLLQNQVAHIRPPICAT